MRMRLLSAVTLAVTLSAIPARAAGGDEQVPSQQSIDALAAKARVAQPREQCFLYAELVNQMSEFSLRQYGQGNTPQASEMLKGIQQLASKIHLSLSNDDKKLKHAEILLRQTAFRLKDMLHNSSYEDRPLVEETMAQVNRAENEAMLQVFSK
jgi:hypothetical protein